MSTWLVGQDLGPCMGPVEATSSTQEKSEEWVIGVVVGWSHGSKFLRLTFVLCERVFTLLPEPISGWIKACGALGPVGREGVPQHHQKQCCGWMRKPKRWSSHGLSLIKHEKDPTPNG